MFRMMIICYNGIKVGLRTLFYILMGGERNERRKRAKSQCPNGS